MEDDEGPSSPFSRMVEAFAAMDEGMKTLVPPQLTGNGINAVVEEIEHHDQGDKFVEWLRHKLQQPAPDNMLIEVDVPPSC